MRNLNISHQTLQEFIDKPFGIGNKEKNIKYRARYETFRKQNKIKVESAIEYEENYFVHIKVPSESQKGASYYDVVIQFFTPNAKVKRQLSLKNYYVQFFSNSPGFVYKYAALYKIEGYLIESLYGKFDPATLESLPTKANKNFELYYDSSIYYASRYILDNPFYVIGKLNIRSFKKKPVESFFGDIQSIEDLNLVRNVVDLETSLKKEIHRDTVLSQRQENDLKKNKLITSQILKKKNAKIAKHSTFKNDSQQSKIIKAKPKFGKKKKKTSTKSTMKNIIR